MAKPHSHDHSLHAHDGDAHDHALPADATAIRSLGAALALTAGYAVVEALGGWLAQSLALLSDAGHMATDAAALGLALFAQWVARRPPSPRASYGYARAEVLAAFVNALAPASRPKVAQTADCRGSCLMPAPVPLQPFCGIVPAPKFSMTRIGSDDV